MAQALKKSMELNRERVAIQTAHKSYTYHELDRLSNQLAHAIIEVVGAGAVEFQRLQGAFLGGHFFFPLEESSRFRT